MRRLNRKR